MKYANTNKDLPLKLLGTLLFKQMGYCSYYEVKLRTLSYIESVKTHDISDIDVLGIKFQADMSEHLIGAECKSGESSALDELYKFIGVIDYFKLNKGYLFKTKIHQNARQVSMKKGVSCFTESEIRILLNGFGIDIDKEVNIENAKYKKLINAINSEQKACPKLITYIMYDYWNKEHWRNIHNILHLLTSNVQPSLFNAKSVDQKLFYYFVVELFSIAILKNISISISQNYSDVEHALQNNLYGGPEALDERRRLHDLVSQVTDQNDSFSPAWETDFIGLSTRFSHSSKACSLVINLLQDIRDNCFYSNKIDIKKSLIENYPDLTRKFAQDIMHFLKKYTAIEESVFEEFMDV